MMRTDLTSHPAEKLEIPENTLAVVTAPVYGGKMAPLALERVKDIHTSGAPAVLVVVYGNRVYEKTLMELDAFVSGGEFKVITGETFVGEHLYSTEQSPIVVGRPDVDDLQFTETFGAKVRTKIETAAEMDKLYTVDVNRIQRPYQAFFPLFRLLWRVMKLHKGGVPMPRTPTVDTRLCSHCGYCTVHCLVSAIRKDDGCYTDAKKYIRYYVCVKGRPQKTRTPDTPFVTLPADCFKKRKGDRVIL